MNKCFICGENKVYWMSDFDGEDYGVDEPCIVHNYTCQDCGTDYVVYEPLEIERTDLSCKDN